MNPVAEEILASGRVQATNGEILPLHSHIPIEECLAVQGWVAAVAPRVALEIGLAYGVSSLFVCEALATIEGSLLHVVDPHQRSEWRGVGIHTLARAGFADRYLLHEEPSEICVPRLYAQGLRLGFALIDGWHSFDQTMMELYFVLRMLEVGGAVVLDDVQLPAIAEAASFVATLPFVESLAPPPTAMSTVKVRARRLLHVPQLRVVAFRKLAEDDRPWDWHREFRS